jgi:vitamin B12/bleomycin/antimicrobial peptide transport system ATP-binding/permease protein
LTNQANIKITFKEFFKLLVFPYFKSSKISWLLLAIILSLSVGFVFLNVSLNEWKGRFYDALQNMDKKVFFQEGLNFPKIILCMIFLFMIQLFVRRLLLIRWRLYLTENFINPWLSNNNFYQLTLNEAIDNPDQRISADLAALSLLSLGIFVEIFEKFINLISFIGILWTLSGAIDIALPGGKAFKLQGYLVYGVFLYCFIGTIVTIKLGKPLIKLDFMQEKLEADFRYDLVKCREHAQEIALYNGEKIEKSHLIKDFLEIVKNYKLITTQFMYLTAWSNIFSNASTIFPIIIAAPMYFSQIITFGVLMRIKSAFSEVEDSLSIVVNNFNDIASLTATAKRLIAFKYELDLLSATKSDINITKSQNNQLLIKNLTLSSPDGKIILSNFNLQVKKHEKILLMGPSGLGKSTLLKAIAGIWSYGSGNIELSAEKTMVMPQTAYMPKGSLRDVLIYPLEHFTNDEDLKQLLQLVNLGALAGSLDITDNWQIILSAGEKQRISLIRMIVNQPQWLFMDEATAALDEVNETLLFENLQQYLPNTTIVTISNNKSLAKFHDRIVAL